MIENLVGRIVYIDIGEPSYFAASNESEFKGQIIKVFESGSRANARFLVAIIKLDRPLEIHQEKVSLIKLKQSVIKTNYISIMARHVGHELLELLDNKKLGVNINIESEEIGDRTESQYIGYGVAWLKK